MITTPLTHVIPALYVAVFLGAGSPIPEARNLPPIVFVSRQPIPDDAAAIPGLGPYHRTAAPGGELMVRSRSGRVRALLPAGMFHDVSDPDVSWNGKSIVFAATRGPDQPWRIYVVDARGGHLEQVTRSDRKLDLSALGGHDGFERYDDVDPCWLPDGRICFASTRYPQISQIGRLPVTNLYTVRRDGRELKRITSERNGGEEPVIDPTNGRIVYARWWFNPYRPSDQTPSGVTTDASLAMSAEVVNLWQAVSIVPDGDELRLAGGHPRVRAETMIYEPLVLGDRTLVGVDARQPSLYPDGGELSLRMFPGGFAKPEPVIERSIGSACAPAMLSRDRLMFSADPIGTHDFGIYTVRRGSQRLERIVDLAGTHELDAAMLAPRKRPPILPATMLDLPATQPVTDERHFQETGVTFRFDCLNVFANAGIDVPIPDAPPLQDGLKIRFFASLMRPGHAFGDTVVLVREAELSPSGAVHETDLPADVPMFEQLVDRDGKVLRSASGPAHVPGFNAGRFGTGTKCVGCHIGHSAISVAPSSFQGKWFNAGPSATVSATSTAGGHDPQSLVDRRTKGPVAQVAWVSTSRTGESVRLAWDYPIEVRAVVLYAISPHRTEGTDLRVQESELVFLENDREVHRATIDRALSPDGTRLNIKTTKVDAIEVRLLRTQGTVLRRPAVALAEIETIAKLAEK